jgi:hypothetical protein
MRGLEETSFKQHAALLPDNTTMAIVMAPSGSFLKEKYLSFCNNKQTSDSEILYSDCFTSTTDLGKWINNLAESIETLGNITGRLTSCTLEFCAKKYDNVPIGDHQPWSKESQTLPLSFLEPDEPADWDTEEEPIQRYCVDGDPSCPYSWTENSKGELTRSIAAGLGSYQSALALNSPIYRPSTPDKFPQLFARIAKGVSKVLQSPLNPAATNVTGTAKGPVIFVKVRWVWLTFPGLVALVRVAFLLATVIRSRGEARLFKNSILAAFLFELEGWAAEGWGVEGENGRQTGEDLRVVSKCMFGTMDMDDKADWKFKRQ